MASRNVPDNPPLERTAAAVYFTCGRASRVRRRGRSTALRYPAELMSLEILDRLMPKECHWEVLVPLEAGAFFGHQLLLTLSTDWTDGRTRPLPPSSEELALARLILADLPAIVKQAEAQFIDYEKDEPSPERHARDPHLWIDRDTIADEGPNRWALVVHHDEWPDYGWHVEFDGIRCIEIWAGS